MSISVATLDKYALKLADKIIDIASNSQMIESEDFLLQRERKANQESNKLNFIQNEDDYKVKNITWPTIGDFTESLANKKIDEFIKKTWEFDDCWLYCIDFIDKKEKEFETIYNYRVMWSIPTRRKPIPKFTASVYFTYVVSKIKPKDKIVDLTYVLETQKHVHYPGSSRFRQQWLIDIINMKENVIRDCKF